MGGVAGRLGSLRRPGGVASVRVGVVELITEVGVVGVGLGAGGMARAAPRLVASGSGLRDGVAASTRAGSGVRSGAVGSAARGCSVPPAAAGVLAGAEAGAAAGVVGAGATEVVGGADDVAAGLAVMPPAPIVLERRGSSRVGAVGAVGRTVGARLGDGLAGPVASGGRRTAGGALPGYGWRGGSTREGGEDAGVSSSSPGRGPALRRRMTMAGLAA